MISHQTWFQNVSILYTVYQAKTKKKKQKKKKKERKKRKEKKKKEKKENLTGGKMISFNSQTAPNEFSTGCKNWTGQIVHTGRLRV